jgi:hypothetical protein
MATDVTVKYLESDTMQELSTTLASYLSTGGWNKADIVAMDLSSNVAGRKFSAMIVHLTTPTP